MVESGLERRIRCLSWVFLRLGSCVTGGGSIRVVVFDSSFGVVCVCG